MEFVHEKFLQADSDRGRSPCYTSLLLDAETHCDAASPAMAGRAAVRASRRNHLPKPEHNRRPQTASCSSSRGTSSISSTSSAVHHCCGTTHSSSANLQITCIHTQRSAAPHRPQTACCSRSISSRGALELPVPGSPAEQHCSAVPHNGIGLQQHHSAFLRAWHYRVRSSITVSQATTPLVTVDTMQHQQCAQRQSGQQQQGLPGRMQLPWSHASSCSSQLRDQLSRLQHISSSLVQESSMSTAAAGARLAHRHEPREQRMFHRLQAALDSSHASWRQPIRLAAVQSFDGVHEHYARFGPYEAAVAQGTHQHVPAWDWQLSDGHISSERFVFFDDSHSYEGQAGLASASSPSSADVTSLQLSAARAAELLDKCTVKSSKKQVETCCICLDDIAVNQLAPLLMCGHRLHRLCLIIWLGQRLLVFQAEGAPSEQSQAVTCPTCKQVSVDRRLLSAV